MVKALQVRHIEHSSDRPYDEVVQAFYAATGNAETGIGDMVAGIDSRERFEAEFVTRQGSSGFMRFLVLDHGDWLTRFYDRPSQALLAIIGNPLVAITMLGGDLQVGLNVPTRIYILGGEDGHTTVSYDLPSSLMSDLSPESAAVAVKLDTKLTELATQISGAGPAA